MPKVKELIRSARQFQRLCSPGALFALAIALSGSSARATDLWIPPLALSAEHYRTEAATGYTVSEYARALLLPTTSELAQSRPSSASFARESVPTKIGSVVVTFPRPLSSSLGYSPLDAVQNAWRLAADVIERYQIPIGEPTPGFDWNVIFSGSSPLHVRGSRVSSAYCHTALMGPPGDIVIDAARLMNPCEGSEVAGRGEAFLTQSLVHEVGHGVEYHLLGKGFNRRQRWHGEGFASWFELAGAEVLNPQTTFRKQMLEKSRRAFSKNWKPYLFRGSPEDYAMSYLLVAAIADGRSREDLYRVYGRMDRDSCTFEQAVERELGLSFEQWIGLAEELLTRS